MPLKMGLMAATCLGILVTTGAGQALGAAETPPAASLTVRPGTRLPSPAPAVTPPPAEVAQSGIGAGPLQGPLAAPGTGSAAASACCPCRTVHHVVHRRRVVRRAPPILIAQAPRLVPLVPLMPYRPVFVYRPLVVYRPFVPVYPRPLFYRPFRPYEYRIY